MRSIPVSAYTAHDVERLVATQHQSIGITGESGSGKGYIAHLLAARVLGVQAERVNDYPYLIRINNDQNGISVDDIRELQRKLALTVPGEQQIRRVVILEDFDVCGTEAQNALLKTLEEPPEDTMIILTFSDSMAVLQTIQSRLSDLMVRPIALKSALQHGQEMGRPPSEVKRAYYMSAGQAGLFAALLNDEDHPMMRTINEAKRLLAASRFERLAEVDALTKHKERTPLSVIDALYRLLSASYHQALQASSRGSNDDALEATVKRMDLVDEAFQDLRHNVNIKLVLTRLFARL